MSRRMSKISIMIVALALIFSCTSFAFAQVESGHRWGPWITEKQPTCGEDGYKYRVCDRIPGTTHSEEVILPKTGKHTFQMTEEIVSCTEPGKQTFTCQVCGYSYSEEIPAVGHKYGEWETITAPTEEAPGLSRRVCQNNPEHIQEKAIPKLASATDSEPKPVTKEPDSGLNILDILLSSLFFAIVCSYILILWWDYRLLRWHKQEVIKFFERGGVLNDF